MIFRGVEANIYLAALKTLRRSYHLKPDATDEQIRAMARMIVVNYREEKKARAKKPSGT